MLELFAGWLLVWPALAIVIILIIVSEHYEARKSSIFLTFVSAVQLVMFFSLSLNTVLIGLAVYIPIGILFSFWRYKRYVHAVVRRIKYLTDAYEKQRTIKKITPAAMLSTIVNWVLAWPFSMLGSLISDIVVAVELLITHVFKTVYQKIYASAMKELQDEQEKNDGKQSPGK